MISRRWSLVALYSLAALAAPALAAELGDAALPVKVDKWLKGGPVDFKDGKHVYVLEFWATWCGPCRMSIPYLTELQKEFKDKGVVVVGYSVDDKDKRKTRDKVEPFVKDWGEKMEYAVALGDEEGATFKAWDEGYKIEGIPTAFIIDKSGKTVWIGHPMEGLDKALEEVLAGKFDLPAAKKADQARRKQIEEQEKILQAMEKYFELVTESDKPEGAEKAGREVFTTIGPKNADMLNAFAWELLTNEAIKFRDLKLALEVAKAAYDACEGKNAAIVDTYARALFDNGKQAEAIEFQKKAVALAEDEEMKKELADTLKRYEQAAKK